MWQGGPPPTPTPTPLHSTDPPSSLLQPLEGLPTPPPPTPPSPTFPPLEGLPTPHPPTPPPISLLLKGYQRPLLFILLPPLENRVSEVGQTRREREREGERGMDSDSFLQLYVPYLAGRGRRPLLYVTGVWGPCLPAFCLPLHTADMSSPQSTIGRSISYIIRALIHGKLSRVSLH